MGPAARGSARNARTLRLFEGDILKGLVVDPARENFGHSYRKRTERDLFGGAGI
jgi:hypothetical protein